MSAARVPAAANDNAPGAALVLGGLGPLPLGPIYFAVDGANYPRRPFALALGNAYSLGISNQHIALSITVNFAATLVRSY